ncbi:MAG: DegT/DnrJ/EryC1/StrS family aminotransferase [Dethiobacter sp.]|nr:DegT/DnrJ/EryC1/StrS family aminotransferase [Dethiobacter sp.]
MFVPLSSPDITDKEILAVNEVLDTRFLALGPKVSLFEEKLAGYVGSRFGIAVNSGTSGLHLLVRALGIEEGDEVITTPFSFIASANCLLFERARPVFVDIDPDTLNIDPGLIKEAITPRTKAILPVHAFGQAAQMEAIREIAEHHGLKIIEDACEAIGAKFRGKMAGTLGEGAVFAFYPNKQITTGEGGMIVTDNEEVARLCRSMRNQGRGEGGGWLDHERLGYNYRMDELSAALGVVQVDRLPEILAKRAGVAERYNSKLAEIAEVRVPYVSPQVEMSWFVYVIRLAKNVNRNGVMSFLLERGVQCRPYFTPIHLQPFYREMFGYKEGDFPVTEEAGKSVVALPFYSNLTEEQADYVVRILREAIALNRR